MLTRREVLGASVLLLGFPWSVLGGDDDETPWSKARALMKKHGRPGLAIPIPKDEKARKKLGRALEKIMGSLPGFDLGALLIEAVWVCVPAGTVDTNEDENAVLVDADGKRVAGTTLDFDDRAAFVRAARKLIEGEGRLEKRAKTARTDDFKAALAELAKEKKKKDDEEPGDGQAATPPKMAGLVDESIAAIVHEVRTTDDETLKKRLQTVVEGALTARFGATDTLPYGVSWETPQGDACPGCGMAVMVVRSRTFVKFLTK